MTGPDRIRATHVGSLVRPDELVALLQQPSPDPTELEEVLDRSVHDVVRQQVDAGIDIVSDGEYGKTYSWSQYVLKRLGGLELRPAEPGGTNRAIGGKDRRNFAEFYEEYEGALGVPAWAATRCPPATGRWSGRSATPATPPSPPISPGSARPWRPLAPSTGSCRWSLRAA